MLGGGKAQNPPESGLGRSTLGCSTSLPESQSIDPGPMHPLDQVAGMGRRMILPYHDDVLLNLKAEGKLLAGGYAVGEGRGVHLRGGLQRRVGRLIAGFASLGVGKDESDPTRRHRG